MADLFVGIRIGAALAGSFSSAFAGARGTLGQLGQVADQLRARHARLGEAMARAASHPARNNWGQNNWGQSKFKSTFFGSKGMKYSRI
jgi:hypothetical protein